MPDELTRALTATGTREVRVRPALVVADPTGRLAVNVDGATPEVLWPVGCLFRAGDVVRALITPERTEVLPPVLTEPRPVTGTVAGSASAGYVPVTTDIGQVSCRYTGTAPALGALVRLDWAGTEPWVWPGAVATATPDPLAPAAPAAPLAPPGPPATGTLKAPAVDSAAWAGHRGTWSTTTRTDLLQGSYRGFGPYSGAWWYGAQLTALKGRIITRFRLYVPARIPGMGAWSAAAALHLYRHTQASRTSTEPPRAEHLTDVVLPMDAGPHWVDLPTAAGQALVDSGGGIACYGDPYTGVRGVAADPQSGRVLADWKR